MQAAAQAAKKAEAAPITLAIPSTVANTGGSYSQPNISQSSAQRLAQGGGGGPGLLIRIGTGDMGGFMVDGANDVYLNSRKDINTGTILGNPFIEDKTNSKTTQPTYYKDMFIS